MFIAVRTGLEPATPCVTGMYSNQLNYRTIDSRYFQRYCYLLILQNFCAVFYEIFSIVLIYRWFLLGVFGRIIKSMRKISM